MSGCINDDALVEAFAAFLGQHWPFVFCYTCLAERLDTSEFALRIATQRLLNRDGWAIGRRFCHGCATQGLVLERLEPAIIRPVHVPDISDERCIV